MPLPTSRDEGARSRFERAHKAIAELFPHLYPVLDNERDFIELRIKLRDDGTCLVVLKRYDGDGSPSVCFGSGYGAVGALLGVDGTCQAGNWRPDTPWQG